MENAELARVHELFSLMSGIKLPRWRELPDLELYMDQVLSLVDRYLGGYPGFDKKGLTASMVNNYVKQGIMPAPIKKRYNRVHLAHLIMICILKASLPISSVHALIEREIANSSEEEMYDLFCRMLEDTNIAAAEAAMENLHRSDADPLASVLSTALRAQAEKALAFELLTALSVFTDGSQS